MFSGIGSGVGAMSPITSGASFANPTSTKREDMEGAEAGPDSTGKGTKGRRRKLKDDDSREDDGSGRLPSGHKSKRPKGHPHHHHQ